MAYIPRTTTHSHCRSWLAVYKSHDSVKSVQSIRGCVLRKVKKTQLPRRNLPPPPPAVHSLATSSITTCRVHSVWDDPATSNLYQKEKKNDLQRRIASKTYRRTKPKGQTAYVGACLLRLRQQYNTPHPQPDRRIRRGPVSASKDSGAPPTIFATRREPRPESLFLLIFNFFLLVAATLFPCPFGSFQASRKEAIRKIAPRTAS